MSDLEQLENENARLKRELADLNAKTKKDKQDFEQKAAKLKEKDDEQSGMIKEKGDELAQIRHQMVQLTRQLHDEVARRDEVEAETTALERRLHDIESKELVIPTSPLASKAGAKAKEAPEENGQNRSQVSTKLMRVIDQWLHTKDLQQVLLRGAAVNDMAFSTLVQVLGDCKSLQMLDLCQNQLTMDSCSDICRLITSSPSLSFISLAENLFSLRSVGYFMTAVMERQNKKKLIPLEVLDIQKNEGLVAALTAPAPDNLVQIIKSQVPAKALLPRGAELIAQVTRALWRFLHYTGHPQVKDTNVDEVAFHSLDKMTIRKMENALMKIMLMAEDNDGGHESSQTKTIYANMVFVTLQESDGDKATTGDLPKEETMQPGEKGVHLPTAQDQARPGGAAADAAARGGKLGGSAEAKAAQKAQRAELRDPFSDLKAAFEPPKEKLKTFNLKQIVTRNGTVLMNMLERLLETTEIDARDVETDQTLLEYACSIGNLGLAKLCYRRGGNLSARTKKGESYFNIVTKNKRYDLMEFLHTYGVKVNHQDADGRTALHIAAAQDDVDAVCRLLEWGADVNQHDHKKRMPLHTAASSGHMKVTMLLLEVGAELNAKDEKACTAVAHAEANNHFALMDRLVQLGGKGHGLQEDNKKAKDGGGTGKALGDLNVTASMLKSSSLGRIGKVAVKDLPGQLRDRFSASAM
eukprot:TRINITY_DN1098_c0_g1_i1.p1 TRINITY_DN1098_c0_g1~~TRINITY_DN1098_c0_g1_i1.p1  ORF type:complete len:696 (+),score=210.22 TRINITY_DN1098_c0_g1_i1:96-2183(+)